MSRDIVLMKPERFFASGGVLPPAVPVVSQPRLSVLPQAASVRVSWSALPRQIDATMEALRADWLKRGEQE